MSFTTGGPRRDDFFKVPGAGAPVKPGPKAPVDRTSAMTVGTFQAVTPMPQRLFAHQRKRAAARSAGDEVASARQVRVVAGDLEFALTALVLVLRAVGHPKARERVRVGAEQLSAAGDAGYRPVEEAAEFLGLTGDEAAAVLTELAEAGVAGPVDEAAARIDELREQVRAVEDDDELDRLLDALVRPVVLASVAGAATPFGAATTGDPAIAETAKSGVVALVALALTGSDAGDAHVDTAGSEDAGSEETETDEIGAELADGDHADGPSGRAEAAEPVEDSDQAPDEGSDQAPSEVYAAQAPGEVYAAAEAAYPELLVALTPPVSD